MDNEKNVQKDIYCKLTKKIKYLDISKTQTFEEFQKIIISKKLITQVQKFLTYLYEYVKDTNGDVCKDIINSKIFIYIYVISYFPKIALNGNEKLELDDEIYKISTQIYHTVKDIMKEESEEKFIKLHQLIEKYKIIFKEWKNRDMECLVKTLALNYMEFKDKMELLIEEPSKSKDALTFIAIYQNQLFDIEKKVKQLKQKELFDKYVKSYMKHTRNIQKQIKPQIEKTLKKAYWDSFEKRVSQNPPDFKYIFILLKEIKNKLILMNNDAQKEIEEFLDIKFLENQLEKGLMNNKKFMDVIVYIINLILDFNKPFKGREYTLKEIINKNVKRWKKEILNAYEKNMSFSHICVLFFRDIYKVLEDLNILLNSNTK
jgi:hypothetical protein